ncbi:hypothetical protein [Deinococcus navajonensis]|uniref:Uncharacterized protein n=1 Tax=Deinococcus navajonensis TaxID=309884 RepID=A0ABV8XLP5_9DEIO
MLPRAEGLEQVRRWRWTAFWLAWMGLSPVAFQSDSSPPHLFSDAVYPLAALLGAGAAAGMVLGGLLIARSSGAPGVGASGPPAQVRTINRLSVALMVALVLGVAAVHYAHLRSEPGYARSVLDQLVRSLELEEFSRTPCPGTDPSRGPAPGEPWCLGTRQDGWMAARSLQRALTDREARLVPSAVSLPLERRGNQVGGQVTAGLLAYNFRRYPVRVNYQGVVYTGRVGPLSADEQAQATEFPSLVRLEIRP